MAGPTSALLALCLVVISCSSVAAQSGYSLNCSQVLAAAADLRSAILTEFSEDEDGRIYRPLIGGLVRLAFHMCAGGKCKGCINPDDRNNIHLDHYVAILEQLYTKHNSSFSRGDFWVLASLVALRESEKITNDLLGRSFVYMRDGLKFNYGRIDCSSSSPFTNVTHEFPRASRGVDHVLQYFAEHFNLNADETVLLMGAHKLGGFRNPQTGKIFRQWVSPADTLTNEYYTALLNDSHGWTQVPVAPCANCTTVTLFQNALGKRLMFNVDVSLRKNLTFANGVSGAATCTVATCADSSTLPSFQVYAESDDYWEIGFAEVFMKMVQTGYGANELQTLSSCSTLSQLEL